MLLYIARAPNEVRARMRQAAGDWMACCRSGETELTWMGFVLLFVAAALMTAANLLMKRGIMEAGGFEPSVAALLHLLARPAFVVGFLLSGVAALLWFRILATQKLSTCYPLFVSLTYSLITLVAFYYFHEKISTQKLLGLLAIVLGITAVARG